jgi:hypothetical protein
MPQPLIAADQVRLWIRIQPITSVCLATPLAMPAHVPALLN